MTSFWSTGAATVRGSLTAVKMRTKIRWIVAVGIVILGWCWFKSHRVKPEPIPPRSRQQILDELAPDDVRIESLTPNASKEKTNEDRIRSRGEMTSETD